jgi:hypothetical protein
VSIHRHHTGNLFPEERAPCGAAGGLSWHYCSYDFKRRPPDLSDCLVSRVRPWILVIWEPLRTVAPSPALCAPWCCYICTVIFYATPHVHELRRRYWRDKTGVLRLSKGGFEQYDQVETRLIGGEDGDIVTFEGEQFTIGGGSVRWARKRWWMCRCARRKRAEIAA